tara:strand:- start:44 stop:388 length:345 start_codon:yes stop_codon:yes gene_type:complete
MLDPDTEKLTLNLTSYDLLVVEYDKGELTGSEKLFFSVQDKRGGRFTHIQGEDLIAIITTYSPQMTIGEMLDQETYLMDKVRKWQKTCELPYQESAEYDADLDVKEAMLERSNS